MANSNWNICFCKSDRDYLQHLLILQPGLGEKNIKSSCAKTQLSLVFDIPLLVRIISVTFEGFFFWGVTPMLGNNTIQ